MDLNDLVGKRFVRLTVISYKEKRGRGYYYNCLCDCGNTKVVSRRCLKEGMTKSCGCFKTEVSKRILPIATGRVGGTSLSNIDTKRYKNNKSGVRGVRWIEKYNKWYAQITFKGTMYYLGYHVNFEDAVRVRKEAEEKLWSTIAKEREEYLAWLESLKVAKKKSK